MWNDFAKMIKRQWWKFLLVALILFIAAIIINHTVVSPIISIVAILLAVLGGIGLLLRLVKTVATGSRKMAQGLKNGFAGTAKRQKKKGKDIVTLLSANGEEIDFLEIAGIALPTGFYAILQPVILLEGMSADEALVFKVTRGTNGEDHFNIELNDDIIDAVFAEYGRLLDEARAGR